MRKYLSHAFSDRSLKDQEFLVAEIVDLLVEQLGQHASGEEGADFVMWYNLTTFDIIGSLAFGQSFEGLRSGESQRRSSGFTSHSYVLSRNVPLLDQTRHKGA